MVRFTCKGFQPRKEFLEYAEIQLEKIFSAAPSDATIKATAERREKTFEFHVELRSSSGCFAGSTAFPIPAPGQAQRDWMRLAVDLIMADIKEQFARWHKDRAA